jgi:hypothetical protein
MRPSLTLLFSVLGFVALGWPSASRAEEWQEAENDVARLGLAFVVCTDNPTQVACLGIGCSADRPELVSVRSGGGAFEGRTAIETGSGTFHVEFGTWDRSIMDVIGVSGSRAQISIDVLEAISHSNQVTFKGPNYNQDVFSTAGLEQLINASKASCLRRK